MNDIHNIQGFIHEAQIQGLNMKILYEKLGMQFHEFNAKNRDDKFTIDEKNTIIQTIKNWKKGE